MKVTLVVALACVAMLAGCANGFTEYYHGMTKEQVDARIGARPPTDPRTDLTSDVKGESESRLENGYAFIGESGFQGPRSRFAESKAIAQAKSLGADLVVLSEGDAGSETVDVPIVTPTTSTSHSSFNGTAFNPAYGSTNVSGMGTTTSYATSTTLVPMTVHRANYYAGYWVKSKPPILGINVLPLTAEQHKQIGTNSGLLVRVVVIGSPAYKADLFKGDYLMSINGESIGSVEDFQRVTHAYAGQNVKVAIMRDGNIQTKDVQFAPVPQ
jgi:hypothetical protein